VLTVPSVTACTSVPVETGKSIPVCRDIQCVPACPYRALRPVCAVIGMT